mmetsp:Transcript_17941/g.28612  ORF Transcript_17941/g.28612 Transcript_17941/m.28612 type:complete len:202 (-) Transcript_17941:755-1360(-)
MMISLLSLLGMLVGAHGVNNLCDSIRARSSVPMATSSSFRWLGRRSRAALRVHRRLSRVRAEDQGKPDFLRGSFVFDPDASAAVKEKAEERVKEAMDYKQVVENATEAELFNRLALVLKDSRGIGIADEDKKLYLRIEKAAQDLEMQYGYKVVFFLNSPSVIIIITIVHCHHHHHHQHCPCHLHCPFIHIPRTSCKTCADR